MKYTLVSQAENHILHSPSSLHECLILWNKICTKLHSDLVELPPVVRSQKLTSRVENLQRSLG